METLLNWLWQGGAIAVALWTVLHGLRRVPAKTRYVLCWLAKLAVATLPVVAMAITSAPVGLPIEIGDAVISVPDAWWTSSELVVIAWAAWAAVASVRLIPALVAFVRLRRGARAFPDAVAAQLRHWPRVRAAGRRSTLTVSDDLAAAAALAGQPPMIAVAASLVSDLTADDLDRVVVHEWAHLQRRDDLACIVEAILRIAIGWHPAMWWIDRRLHVEREVACDAMVVAVTGSPKQYAACLVTLADRQAVAPALTALAVVRTSNLRERVVRLIGRPRALAPTAARGLTAAAAVALTATTALLSQLALVDANAMILPAHRGPDSHPSSLVIPVPASPTSPDVATTRLPSPTVLASQTSTPAVRERATEHEQQRPATGFPSPKEPSPTQTAPDPSTGSPAVSADPPEPAAAAPPSPQPQVSSPPPAAAADPDVSPWAAVADRGVALGTASKAAGVRAGNAFTRFGRRIASAF
jgi:beta-lactamase regulating signal transducer with metallopeptidase domain